MRVRFSASSGYECFMSAGVFNVPIHDRHSGKVLGLHPHVGFHHVHVADHWTGLELVQLGGKGLGNEQG